MEFPALAERFGAPLVHARVGDQDLPDSFVARSPGLPDVEVRAEYGSGNLTEVVLRVAARLPAGMAAIRLDPETGIDRRGKQLGLNREVQTGDAAFDREVYIRTEASDALVARILADEAVRARLRQIVGPGRAVVIEGELRVTVAAAQLDELTPEVARALAEIPGRLPDLRHLADDRRGPRAPRFGLVSGFVLTIGLFVAAAKADAHEPIFWSHCLRAFLCSLIPWSLFVAVLVFDRRGRPDSFGEIVMVGLYFMLVFGITGTFLAMAANSRLDTSAPRVTQVRAQYVDFQKEEKEHRVRVFDFEGQPEVELELDGKIDLGDHETLSGLELTVRDGRLGWPYIVSAARAP
jgi:hypothetical protein